MKADKTTLEGYEDKASKGEYGELTNQAYNDIEKDSGRYFLNKKIAKNH